MIFLSVFSSTGDRDKALPRPRLHCTTLSAVMQNLKNTQLRFYRKEILTKKVREQKTKLATKQHKVDLPNCGLEVLQIQLQYS